MQRFHDDEHVAMQTSFFGSYLVCAYVLRFALRADVLDESLDGCLVLVLGGLTRHDDLVEDRFLQPVSGHRLLYRLQCSSGVQSTVLVQDGITVFLTCHLILSSLADLP